MAKDGKSMAMPTLRFPEFRDAEGWDVGSLTEVADFVNERTPLSNVSTADYVSTENLLPDYGGMTAALKLPTIGSVTRYQVSDVLISNIRPYLKKVWHADRNGGASNDVVVVRGNGTLSKVYLSLILKNDLFIAYVMAGAKGVKMPGGDVEAMRQYPVAYPGEREQQKIADCLTSLDEGIAAQGRKVEVLKAYKRGLMQQLFPREGETLPRLRFPEFSDGPRWKFRLLGEFISERCEIADGTTPLFSLTIEHGVTAKTARYERSFLVTSKEDAYKQVLPNDFAFNPMNLRFGAIGRHSGSQPVAVSKYYNIFSCDDSVDPRFCELYFRSEEMVAFYDAMATGSLIEKRRVHFDRFLKFNIPFPGLKEQRRIADCLAPLGAQIAAESKKLDALMTHKKGLMQQLFPSPEEV